MHISSLSEDSGSLSHFEAQCALLEDLRPHPPEAALIQIGHAVTTEMLDLLGDTALEDFQPTIVEALIGAFHSASQRIERDADRARDTLGGLLRDFDGSEILDTEIQDATRRTRSADIAVLALEIIRDAAAASYQTATGEIWSPWKGVQRATRTSAAQIEAREALKSAKATKAADANPGDQVVAFRAAPHADTGEDASRIFDALNWAKDQWPRMSLVTSGAKGAEKLAIKWAKQKGVTVLLARADFDKHGRAAPFRVNDLMLEFEPVLVLTLSNTLNRDRAAQGRPFGPALNLAQKASEAGIRHHSVRSRP